MFLYSSIRKQRVYSLTKHSTFDDWAQERIKEKYKRKQFKT